MSGTIASSFVTSGLPQLKPSALMPFMNAVIASDAVTAIGIPELTKAELRTISSGIIIDRINTQNSQQLIDRTVGQIFP